MSMPIEPLAEFPRTSSPDLIDMIAYKQRALTTGVRVAIFAMRPRVVLKSKRLLR